MLHHVGVLSKDDLAAIQARHGRVADRDSRRPARLVARQGRRPPQHRSRADRKNRRCRQAPAHRPLAQRPGGDRYPPVSARCDRPHSGRPQGLPDLAGRPGRTAHRHGDARLHPPAGGAAGDLRPSSDGLFRNAGARRRAHGRLPPPRQSPAAGRGRAGRHQLSRSTATLSRANWVSTASAKTRSTPSPTATSPSNSPPPPRW